MKKFLLSFLALCMSIGICKAGVITVDPDGTGVTWTAETDEVYGAGFSSTFDGVKVGYYKYKSSSAAVTGKSELRIYQNSVIVITPAEGEKVKSVVFTASAVNYCKDMTGLNDAGNATANTTDKTVTWSGSVSPLVLQATAQVRATQIVITTAADGEVMAPTFSVAAGTYYEAQTVTITNPNSSGDIVYTTDGNEPTATSTKYTEPIAISATTTLKAAVVDGDKISDVTTAEYVIATAPEVASISDFLKLSKGEKAKFTNPVVVAAVYKSTSSASYYVTDETAGVQIYDSSNSLPEYKAGDVIPAGFTAEYTLYNSVPEAVNVTGAVAATETKTAPYKVTTIAELTNSMVGYAVEITDATVKEVSGKNFTVQDESGSIAGYDKFSIDVQAYSGIKVRGIVNINNSTLQLMPYSIDYTGGTAIVELDAPTFDVAAGTYYEAQTVTITNPNSTGDIVYTTDGNEPTATSTKYTEPIAISTTTTLKAAVVDGDKISDVTTAEYVISSIPEVASISDFLKLSKGDKAKFKNPVTVAAVYKSGSNVSYYVTDETAGVQIYDKGGNLPAYEAKDIIPAGFTAEYDIYSSVPEAVNVTGAVAATETQEAPYQTITVEEISTSMVGAAVEVDAAEIKDISGKNFNVADESGSIAAYNKFSIDVQAYTGIKVRGIVNINKSALQIMPYYIDYTGGSAGVEEITDDNEPTVEVEIGNGEIIVTGDAKEVEVYSVDGRRTTSVKAAGEHQDTDYGWVCYVKDGYYIVTADGKVIAKVKIEGSDKKDSGKGGTAGGTTSTPSNKNKKG